MNLSIIKLSKEISQVSDIDDLQSLKNIINHRIACSISSTFKVNDEVKLTIQHQHKKPYDTVGSIKKINPKRFQIDFGVYGVWNIPKTMVRKA